MGGQVEKLCLARLDDGHPFRDARSIEAGGDRNGVTLELIDLIAPE
jgi:hypothetical protein